MDEIELSLRAETSLAKLLAAADSVRDASGYRVLSVPKRRGGVRRVLQASPGVDKQQSAVKSVLDKLYKPASHVHGYVAERDNFTNALPHLGRSVVLRVDLQAFFPSVTMSRLDQVLADYGLSESARRIVLGLACVDGRLATGFPTSPVLSNIAFAATDEALRSTATALDINFTRYADDMSFSGATIDDNTLATIVSVLSGHGWSVNHNKTRFMRSGGPQYVTGLYVGLPDRPRVPRRMKRALRQQLHYLASHGYLDCHKRVPWTMGSRRVLGWINYVSRVEPDLGREFGLVAGTVDFGLTRRIGFDDEWDSWLDEVGVPEDL